MWKTGYSLSSSEYVNVHITYKFIVYTSFWYVNDVCKILNEISRILDLK